MNKSQTFVDRRPIPFATIIVDYKNKRVKFEDPEKEKHGSFSFLATLYCQYLHFFAIPIILLVILIGFVNSKSDVNINAWLVFILPVLGMILHLNNKTGPKIAALYPKYIAWKRKFFGSYNRRIFKNITAKRLEIPSFGNVLLEYETTKDYNKYLQRVEVKQKKVATKVSRDWYGKEKKIDNILIWTAYFHFSKIPKEGELKCYWK